MKPASPELEAANRELERQSDAFQKVQSEIEKTESGIKQLDKSISSLKPNDPLKSMLINARQKGYDKILDLNRQENAIRPKFAGAANDVARAREKLNIYQKNYGETVAPTKSNDILKRAKYNTKEEKAARARRWRDDHPL